MVDVFGKALADYYYAKNTDKILWLHNSYGPPEEMPVDVFFRQEEEMPGLELLAIDYCRGKVLDVGAGVGSHVLLLQQEEAEVTALEYSAEACSIMHSRGVKQVINKDIFDYNDGKFDTLLLLMNGIGLCGDLSGLRRFLRHAATLLNQGGQLLFDSSDIAYLYEDAAVPEDQYYGEISYRYQYENKYGPWFKWLYIDWHTMADIAAGEGWSFRLLHEDGQDQYLAALEINA